ncbi:MAG TPA: YfhO family protein [Candidatus Binatia bacterium]|nr:YfhO family protein [Candidatus Binatia bacterium]
MTSPSPRTALPTWLAVAVAAVAYALVTVAVTWPVFRHPASTVLDTQSLYGDAWSLIQRDINLTMWILAWDTHALTTHPTTLFHANAFHPAPWVLATSEHMLGNVPWFAPIFLATGNPVLAHQLTLLASFVVAGLAMAALVLYWTNDRTAAFVAGLCYALAPYRLWQLGNLHVIAIQYLPLVLLGIDGILDRRRPRLATLLLGGALVASTACSYYVGYAAFVLACVYACAGLVGRRAARGRSIGLLALAATLAAIVVGLVTIPYVLLQRSGALPDQAQGGFDSLAFFGVLKFGVTGMLAWFVRPRVDGIPQYLGLVAMALAAAALVLRRGAPRGALTAVIVAGVVLYLGPIVPNPWTPGVVLPTPYAWLAAVVPGFSAMRAPQRFGCLATVGVMTLAGLGLAALRARLRDRGQVRLAAVVPWVLAAVMLIEVRPPGLRAMNVPPEGSTPQAARWLREHGEGGVVLNLPFNRLELYRESGYLYDSIFHWSPIVNGYASYPPATYVAVGQAASTLPDPAALDAVLALVDVRWIVLHLGGIPPRYQPAWRTTLDAALQPVAEFPGAVIYAVPPTGGVRPPPPTGRRAAASRDAAPPPPSDRWRAASR